MHPNVSFLTCDLMMRVWVQHEKHKAKKEPENARSHRVKEEIAATIAAGSVGLAIHEHHKKKEAKKHGHHH
jgi:hypothetical protein